MFLFSLRTHRLSTISAIGVFVIRWLAATATAQNAAPSPPQPADVMRHLQLTVDWYRQVMAAGEDREITTDVVSQSRLHQTAVEALQLGFDFARAQAVLLRGTQAGSSDEAATRTPSNIEQVNARLNARISELQAKLNDLDASLGRATPKTRDALRSERDAVAANLQLVKAIQATVAQIVRFASHSQLGNAPDALTAQIDALQRTVPEARHAASPSPAAPGLVGAAAGGAQATSAPAAPTPRFEPETAGVVALATELMTMGTARRRLTTLLRTTDALDESIDSSRAPLGANIRELIRQAEAAGNAGAPAIDVQAGVARVRQLSTVLVPLGEQDVALEAARNVLVESRNDLAARFATAARYLAIRAAILLIAIAVVLVISELWRRATFKYLHDVRRRRQFLLLRRVVVGAAVVVIVVIGFVSQIGSLATYIGFVTAGVAVALQNVILAVVAYFFLIGRYGVRVGDRITIGGVTGNVVEIGLVRIYLMEVTGPDWMPTGRIVVFSNAVLFQPAALFKQMPGVDYGWRAVSLTLAPNVDLARAERDIRSAVDAVYEDFREPIERQHARLQENVQFQTPVPKPDVQIRVADEGLVLTIRYPAERMRATEMDNRMMTAIRDAIAKGIPLTPTGSPKLESPAAPTPASAS